MRSTERSYQEQPYQQVGQHVPLISVENIAEGESQPLAAGASTPLDGIRAWGMGHVVAAPGPARHLPVRSPWSLAGLPASA